MDRRAARLTGLLGLLYLALFAWACAVFGVFVKAATVAPQLTVDQVAYNFYYYGGLPLALVACVVLFSFFAGARRPALMQYFLWAALLFSFNYATMFIANLFNLRSMTFLQGFTWLSDYLPSMILCVLLVALLSQWGKGAGALRAVHVIAWVGLLFSAFMACYVVYYLATSADFSQAKALYSGLFQIAHAALLPVAIAWLFAATRSPEVYAWVFFRSARKGVEDGEG
ncbi:MAG: hypothetical protein LBR44_00740 [Clostridiales Family XIII bacterium]|jgi:hypothetical protein|nr:hypothetical protein [Clostridiales Family XIII bacterium]